jgi:glycolate oxidase FAD binding subunit
MQALRAQLAAAAPAVEELHTMRSRAFWEEVRDARLLAGEQDRVLWKISCPPTEGARVVATVRKHRSDAQALYDWSGGLVWLSLAAGDPAADDAAHVVVRAALASGGGHATLVRAPEPVRSRVPVFQPVPPALAALSQRVRESFDPRGIFNSARSG